MFGRSIQLFKLFGFSVKIDLSWLILALLISWTLAKGFFPNEYGSQLSVMTYWWMGVAGAIGIFFSIVFHELCHSLVARRFGMPMKGITLFIFGGVAEMSDEPPSAKAEFFMAIIGPISSVVLSGAMFVLYVAGKNGGLMLPVQGVLSYLSLINVILAVFNMLPAFPLDGGRVLRSALWGWRNDLRWATHISSQIGSFFGMFMIFLGVLWILRGDFIGGFWWFLIGMFLRNAAQTSYQQYIVRSVFEGEPIRRFMNPDPITVSSNIPVDRLVDDYIYKYHHKMFPIVDDGQLKGCITTQDIKDIPREQWRNRTVGEIAARCSPENIISPDTDSVGALSIMNKNRNSRLMVVDNNRLVGVISLKDMLQFLSTKMDLEGYE